MRELRNGILLLFVLFGSVLSAIAQKPVRVVSLVPSVTQSILDLKAEQYLVGITSYCNVPNGFSAEVVSSAVKMNVEKILRLKPDIVFVSGLTNGKDVETLKRMGIKVQMQPTPKSYMEICEQFLQLGKILGCADRARQIVEESKKAVQRIKERRIREKRACFKVFMQIGANPIFAVLPNTFMADYISFLGAENIAEKESKGTLTREFVVAKNPDYIIVVTMGIVGEEERDAWRKHKTLTATKNGHIYIVDSTLACQPSPIAFKKTLEILDRYIR
ncbi:MAG: helical backbone metal receptor [Porphyromonas sp.]|nr:helical backbone metal receptor [Porphyromonas sp.]